MTSVSELRESDSSSGNRYSGRPAATTLQLSLLSIYWFSNLFMWGSLLSIVLPSQVEKLFKAEDKAQNLVLVIIGGTALGLVAHPLAGALSDFTTSRWGRRKPWLFMSTIPQLLILIGMAVVPANNLIFLAGLFALLQVFNNMADGPWSAIINDLVPPQQFGRASGWRGLWNILGIITGSLVVGSILNKNNDLNTYRAELLLVYGLYAIVQSIFVVVTVLVVKEEEFKSSARFNFRNFWRSFNIREAARRDFWWLFLTRFLNGMGTWTIFNFLQYYLQDVLHVKNGETELGTYFLPGIMVTALLTVYLAGHISDRFGRKRIIYLSGSLMIIVCLVYMFTRDLWTARFMTVIFGLGYGAYQSVDWALVCDILPEAKDFGRDMGIWEVAGIAPQIFGILIGGTVLTLFKGNGDLPYMLMLGISALYFLLSTIFVTQVKGTK